MTASETSAPPFDIFSLLEDVQDRFGWSNDDLSNVMEQLLPAALNGFRYFGSAVPGFTDFLGQTSPQGFGGPNPFSAYQGLFQTPTDAALTPFFGPEAVQKALADQVSGMTGLQQDAIREMMPVAATLAMGQIARPFVHGEARNLLDAYLRGFARGRPKPQPTPADYLQGYAEAMQAFWGAFLQPASIVNMQDEPEPEPEPEPEAEPEEDEATSEAPSEFEEMVSGWMAAGKDFQSSQFKAFDSFFEKAAKDLGGD
ncbi:MAG: DUF937 domain-containing protein [Roseibium sp.]|uniref:DUF937 domain-containing protein n=1 Tax=Roseibium sp. TaxID=1936156 RepID=UPI001B2C53B4|nr:DUF937 domain-containing protein [Roseibium sp.]MBO6509403.1 DUF937 domain-containing protein [Roseibium sp.]MBO6890531.1 DUF937 domain-containing protein [Roseibium sp.]MBO6929576.1 DUF937 domain-containing protein [Roseibium sp.]